MKPFFTKVVSLFLIELFDSVRTSSQAMENSKLKLFKRLPRDGIHVAWCHLPRIVGLDLSLLWHNTFVLDQNAAHLAPTFLHVGMDGIRFFIAPHGRTPSTFTIVRSLPSCIRPEFNPSQLFKPFVFAH